MKLLYIYTNIWIACGKRSYMCCACTYSHNNTSFVIRCNCCIVFHIYNCLCRSHIFYFCKCESIAPIVFIGDCFTFHTYEIMTSIFQLTFRFNDFHILYVSNNMNRLEMKIYLIQMLIVKHVLRSAIYAYK